MFRLRLRGLIGLALLTAAALALSAAPALATPTAPPTLFTPGSPSQSSTQMHVHYYLPEAAAAGQLKLTFEGGETIEAVLNDAEGTLGEHEFTLNVKSLTGSPSLVASATKSAVPDGSYTVKLTYEGASATSPASVTAASVVIDTVTQTPSLLAPANASVIGEDFSVEYSLPESASPGSAELLITRLAGATSILALPATTAGTHSVTLNPFAFSVGGSLISGPEALSGGEYSFSVGYQDALMNPAAFSSSRKFTFAHPTKAPVLFSPAVASRSSAQLHVHYDLPEAARSTTLKLTFEGAQTTEVTLADAQGTIGEHEFTLNTKSLLSAPVVTGATHSAIADGSYTVTLTYEGATATAPSSVATHEIVLDSVTLSPTLMTPASGSVIGEDFTVDYALPEAASPGTVQLVLTRAGGAPSTVALPVTAAGTHSVTLDPFDLAVGGSLISGPSTLENGEYTLLLSYQDSLLNPVASSSTTFSILRPSAQPGQGGGTAAKGSEVTSSAMVGATSTAISTGNQTPAKPARLSVRWKSGSPKRGGPRALTATFYVVSGARRYTLAITSATARRSFQCRVSGAGRRRRVTCLASVPSKGRWSATATAVGAAGTLASATTNVHFHS